MFAGQVKWPRRWGAFMWVALVWSLIVSGLGSLSLRADTAPKPPFYPDKLHLLTWIDQQGQSHPVESKQDWARRRTDILRNMELVMGDLPGSERRVPLDVKILEETDTPKYIQRKISYAAEKGDRVPAYLLIPKGIQGRTPAMLCLHQTTVFGKGEPVGLNGLPHLFYAKELAERGYICIVPDYPYFGDYQDVDPYKLGYASITMKGIWNHMRAIDLLQTLPEVDGDRVGCIGHSLGGYNTLFVSAFDERIKVAVQSCGFTSFPKYKGGASKKGNLAPWGDKHHHMPRITSIYHDNPAEVPFDFSEVIAAIAPRYFFTNSPRGDWDITGVEDCLSAARPVFALLGVPEHIASVHPNCGHGFPAEAREKAYAFIDHALGITRKAARIEDQPARSVDPFVLTRDRESLVAVYAPGENQWAGQRLVDRIQRWTGASVRLQIAPAVPTGSGRLIAIGTRESNPVVKELLQNDSRLQALGDEGYLIKVVRRADGTNVLVAAGNSLPGVNNAISELVSWKLHIMPQQTWIEGGLDEADSPTLRYRLLWNWDSRTNWEQTPEQMHATPDESYSLNDQGEAGFLNHFKRAIDFFSDHKLNGLTIWGFINDTHGGLEAARELTRYAKRNNVRMLPGVCSEAAYGGFSFVKSNPFNLDHWTQEHPDLRYKNTQGEFIAGVCPSKPENQQWLRDGTRWFLETLPDVGGMNLENGDWFYCWTDDCVAAKSRPENDPNFFWDQLMSYSPILETAGQVRPDVWMIFATYCGFTRAAIEGAMHGAVKTGRAAGVATEIVYPPRFLSKVPKNGICQWTLTGMVTPQSWPQGAKPPTGSFKEHIGYILQAGAIWPPSQPDRWWAGLPGSRWEDIADIIEFLCGRIHAASMSGLVMYGERGPASPANELNYLALEYFGWHPERTWDQFINERLSLCYGDPEKAKLFLTLLRSTTHEKTQIQMDRARAADIANQPDLELPQQGRWRNLAAELSRRAKLADQPTNQLSQSPRH